ncbi:uncharacterized protein LOC131636165 [Vicia villosa]|uniref:uncharacterized protein LOC131636165 n=1 Tax=Vicia villosa TaxID=3911 RepID=UPI00273ADC5E|nr:uncharacterized protein LOC131636165 [Vicia villosa]XP_058762806.1 uncharacterized protein LOC131636165 [Vicia villosa]XP_058762807.1 uncharacterized protein LOC131636165 [Vicia villosa]XP_058762808.1 uncharacterized protein LOC131636165 [Vicia villosa]
MIKRGGKSKVLAPGKLQEQRNRKINKKHTVTKPGHTTVAPQTEAQTTLSAPTQAHTTSYVQTASAMRTPAQTASFVQAASSTRTPARKTSSVQVPSSVPTPVTPTSFVQNASTAHTASVPTPAPVHAATSKVSRFMPTPTLSHQTMVGPQSVNLQTTGSPSNLVEEEDVDDDVDDDEDEAVGQENVTPLVPTLDENGKVIIKPYGTGLAPAKEVADAIKYAIRKQFFKPIHHWTELDRDTKADWFKWFGDKVSWDPCDHAIVYSRFEKKGRKRLNDMMGKAREKGIQPPWIGDEAWVGLQNHWKEPEFLAVSSQNKINRASARGGAVHTSGRKAHLDVALELSHELQRDLRPDELFLKTHKRKNGEWVDNRAASTYKAFREKYDAELQPTEEGNGNDVQVVDGERVNQLWTEAAGGRSRGRVYGAADFAINLKRGSKTFTQQSQTPHHSMFGVSLEAERAARIRAEQIAEAATARLQEANELIRAATEAAKTATETAQRMESEMNAWKELMMKKIDAKVSGSHRHHYDDDLDDLSLDEA